MPTKILKDAVAQHFVELFGFTYDSNETHYGGAGDDVTVTILRNNENPDPPQDRTAREQAHLFVEFEPTKEEGAGLGEAGRTNRKDEGVFYLNVIVAKGRGDAMLDQALEIIRQTLRQGRIRAIEIHDFFEGDKGDRFKGAWEGVALAPEFEHYFAS